MTYVKKNIQACLVYKIIKDYIMLIDKTIIESKISKTSYIIVDTVRQNLIQLIHLDGDTKKNANLRLKIKIKSSNESNKKTKRSKKNEMPIKTKSSNYRTNFYYISYINP